jgi:maltose-binding protein MalE
MKVPKKVPIIIIIVLYLALVAIATVFAANEEPEAEHTPTPTATATETMTPTPTAHVSNCEKDKSNIQTALNAYHEANGDWPTANGQPGDIVWDKLVPEYMSEMPVIDDQCDWQVSGNPEGNVCVSHTC